VHPIDDVVVAIPSATLDKQLNSSLVFINLIFAYSGPLQVLFFVVFSSSWWFHCPKAVTCHSPLQGCEPAFRFQLPLVLHFDSGPSNPFFFHQ
jgi:hypothetical protein